MESRCDFRLLVARLSACQEREVLLELELAASA